MNADHTYFKTEISQIPVSLLKDIILEEITKLLFDFGQKVVSHDPEFDYLVNQTTYALLNYYQKWKLSYLDECFRRAKLDEYDKGQRVTMKRLEFWLKSYNIRLKDAVKKQSVDKVYSNTDNDRFAANSRIYGPAMRFRQMRKPEFDAETWTLEEIVKLPSFLNWMKMGAISPNKTENLIFTKIR